MRVSLSYSMPTIVHRPATLELNWYGDDLSHKIGASKDIETRDKCGSVQLLRYHYATNSIARRQQYIAGPYTAYKHSTHHATGANMAS